MLNEQSMKFCFQETAQRSVCHFLFKWCFVLFYPANRSRNVYDHIGIYLFNAQSVTKVANHNEMNELEKKL